MTTVHSPFWLWFLILLSAFQTICSAEITNEDDEHDNLERPYEAEDLAWRTAIAATTPIRPPPEPSSGLDNIEGNNTDISSHLVCKVRGSCEPCPPESLHEPFCQPFGNRRLMHCVNATALSASEPPLHASRMPQQDIGLSGMGDLGRTLAWESCGRIPQQERADFFEFVACNVGFVIAAIAVVIWRSRVVQRRQARVLAARIGIGGSRGRRA